MKNIIIVIAAFFAFVSNSFAQFISTGDVEVKTHIVYFSCNSSEISYETSEELDFLTETTILSIDAYASVDGSVESNQTLSEKRGHAIASLLDFQYVAHGETSEFGSKAANRCVVITYSVAKATNSANSGNVSLVGKTTNPEGFTCGNKIDPSVYFADTLNETVDTPAIQAPIVLENVSPKLQHDSTSYVVKPVPVDTSFLPVRQAVRYQMREHNMSRSEAIRSIKARKSQWKEIEPKTAKARKSKAKKVSMKRTRGANRSLFVRVFPFAGC